MNRQRLREVLDRVKLIAGGKDGKTRAPYNRIFHLQKCWGDAVM